MSDNKNCKNKKEGDITLHYIDILAMYHKFTATYVGKSNF